MGVIDACELPSKGEIGCLVDVDDRSSGFPNLTSGNKAEHTSQNCVIKW